jgi:heme-degrading monooxygenase HmoA
MIVVANRIPVAKGYEKQFEERFKNRQRLVEQMPGFVKFQLLKPIQGRVLYLDDLLGELRSIRELDKKPGV